MSCNVRICPPCNPCPKHGEPFVFPIDRFIAEFPSFGNEENFTKAVIARCGKTASRFFSPDGVCGFPLLDEDDREYALFLITAHILALRKNADDELGTGSLPAGGRVKKATVGAVSVETDSPNSYSSDDYTYWFSQTIFGQEFLAFIAGVAPAGIYMNNCRDSVRVL